MGDVCQYTLHNGVRGRRPTGVRAKTKLEERVPVDLHQHKGERDIAPKSSNKKTSLHQEKEILHQKKETKVAPGRMSNDIALKTNLMFLPQLALIRDIISLKFVRWRFETHNYRHFQSLLPEHRWPRWIWFMKLTQSRFSSNFKSSEKLIPFEIVLSVDNHFTFAWTWNGWGAYSSQLL